MRRKGYHLHEHILSKTKTARKWFASYFCSRLFSCQCCPYKQQSNTARVSKLRRHIAICRRGNILTTFLMKMGESSLTTKTLLCRRIIKNNALLEKFRRSPRKMGRRRLATEWFERDFKDGNLRKRKSVVICKQLFHASTQPVRRGANLVPRGSFCHALEKSVPIPVADQKDRGLWERDCRGASENFPA